MKATLSVEGDTYELAAANLVRSDEAPAVSHRLAEPIDTGRTLLNLRAEAPPESLKAAVEKALESIRRERPCDIIHLEHFRPGKPVPTHRITARS